VEEKESSRNRWRRRRKRKEMDLLIPLFKDDFSDA
jgi:hypothetical protein